MQCDDTKSIIHVALLIVEVGMHTRRDVYCCVANVYSEAGPEWMQLALHYTYSTSALTAYYGISGSVQCV